MPRNAKRKIGQHTKNADNIRGKIKKEKKCERSKYVSFISLISSWWSSFCVALSAINWPTLVWFEWNFAFLSAVSAGSLVHLFVISHFYVSTPYTFLARRFCLFNLFRQPRIKLIRVRTRFPSDSNYLHQFQKHVFVKSMFFAFDENYFLKKGLNAFCGDLSTHTLFLECYQCLFNVSEGGL